MTSSGGVWVSPLGQGEVLVDVALEHFEEFEVGGAGVLDVVGQSFLYVADVAGLEVHGAGAAFGGENGHAALSCHEVLPFVGVLVPMEFTDAAGMDGDDGGGHGGGDFEFGGVHDADFTALGALGDGHFCGAETEIDGREAQGACGGFAVGVERAGAGGPEDKFFFADQFFQGLLGDAEVLREDVFGSVSHPPGALELLSSLVG